jgi:hypothetical protein
MWLKATSKIFNMYEESPDLADKPEELSDQV